MSTLLKRATLTPTALTSQDHTPASASLVILVMGRIAQVKFDKIKDLSRETKINKTFYAYVINFDTSLFFPSLALLHLNLPTLFNDRSAW